MSFYNMLTIDALLCMQEAEKRGAACAGGKHAAACLTPLRMRVWKVWRVCLAWRARWRSRQCHSRRSARAAAPPSALTWCQTHGQPLLPGLHKPSAMSRKAPEACQCKARPAGIPQLPVTGVAGVQKRLVGASRSIDSQYLDEHDAEAADGISALAMERMHSQSSSCGTSYGCCKLVYFQLRSDQWTLRY